jgi:uncharacterized small protein (DUF1192 family)
MSTIKRLEQRLGKQLNEWSVDELRSYVRALAKEVDRQRGPRTARQTGMTSLADIGKVPAKKKVGRKPRVPITDDELCDLGANLAALGFITAKEAFEDFVRWRRAGQKRRTIGLEPQLEVKSLQQRLSKLRRIRK